MNNTISDPRGSIQRRGSVWRVDNALVEQVSTRDGRTGYILVSYAEPGQGVTNIEQLKLNITNNTSLTTEAGRPVCLCDIKPGMWVDAEFSSMMTRSMPPHTNAFRVVVRQHSRPQARPIAPVISSSPSHSRPPIHTPPPRDTTTTTARVVRVDTVNNMLTTGSYFNINRQKIFTVSRQTQIYNRRGRAIPLRAIRSGQLVRVTHANFQTMSIPPQSPAYKIQVL